MASRITVTFDGGAGKWVAKSGNNILGAFGTKSEALDAADDIYYAKDKFVGLKVTTKDGKVQPTPSRGNYSGQMGGSTQSGGTSETSKGGGLLGNILGTSPEGGDGGGSQKPSIWGDTENEGETEPMGFGFGPRDDDDDEKSDPWPWY